jgi:hypothetical protein
MQLMLVFLLVWWLQLAAAVLQPQYSHTNMYKCMYHTCFAPYQCPSRLVVGHASNIVQLQVLQQPVLVHEGAS